MNKISSKERIFVLTPNRRRHVVKVTSDTCGLEVLEDVCHKNGLEPRDWELKHYSHVIDLANSVRFSGVPIDATLELVRLTKPREESEILVSVQTESGKRFMQQFSSSANLWDILLYWEGEGKEILPEKIGFPVCGSDIMEPVCVYFRRTFIGESQLKAVTLKSLGLLCGSANIRLLRRTRRQLSQNFTFYRTQADHSQFEDDSAESGVVSQLSQESVASVGLFNTISQQSNKQDIERKRSESSVYRGVNFLGSESADSTEGRTNLDGILLSLNLEDDDDDYSNDGFCAKRSKLEDPSVGGNNECSRNEAGVVTPPNTPPPPPPANAGSTNDSKLPVANRLRRRLHLSPGVLKKRSKGAEHFLQS